MSQLSGSFFSLSALLKSPFISHIVFLKRRKTTPRKVEGGKRPKTFLWNELSSLSLFFHSFLPPPPPQNTIHSQHTSLFSSFLRAKSFWSRGSQPFFQFERKGSCALSKFGTPTRNCLFAHSLRTDGFEKYYKELNPEILFFHLRRPFAPSKKRSLFSFRM